MPSRKSTSCSLRNRRALGPPPAPAVTSCAGTRGVSARAVGGRCAAREGGKRVTYRVAACPPFHLRHRTFLASVLLRHAGEVLLAHKRVHGANIFDLAEAGPACSFSVRRVLGSDLGFLCFDARAQVLRRPEVLSRRLRARLVAALPHAVEPAGHTAADVAERAADGGVLQVNTGYGRGVRRLAGGLPCGWARRGAGAVAAAHLLDVRRRSIVRLR